MGKKTEKSKTESKGAGGGVKLESTELESKGAEGGLKLESTSHGSDEPQEDSTERLVSSSGSFEAKSRIPKRNWGSKENCKTAASVFSRAEFKDMARTVYPVCQPGASQKL